MKHFFEIALTALVAVFAAVLGYLFSRDNLVAGACFTGVACGLCIAVAYTLGGMMTADEGGALVFALAWEKSTATWLTHTTNGIGKTCLPIP